MGIAHRYVDHSYW
ncbi:hypothetical protein CP8484711_0415A, partial [Chlamydia psittaci 84-8471/1]